MSAISRATAAPLGTKAMRGNTNASHSPSRSSTARAAAGSFFEQIADTTPRSLNARTSAARFSSSTGTSPSASVPVHSVSSRSHTISFSLNAPASAG